MFTGLGMQIDYYWFMFCEFMKEYWPQIAVIVTWSLVCGLIGWLLGRRKKK